MAVTNKHQHSHRLPCKMGSRTQEIRPVGAWVEPEGQDNYEQQNAVHSAQIEEQRLKLQLQEKEERLRRFQEDVRKRVQALDKVKKEDALRKSYKAVEMERNVVRQSAIAAERTTPRKNRCHHLSLKHSVTAGTKVEEPVTSQHKSVQFEEHTLQVKSFSRQARRNLTSRKVVTEHYLHSDIPGGVWGSHSSQELADIVERPVSEVVVNGDQDESDKENEETRVVTFDPETGLEVLSPQSNMNRIGDDANTEASVVPNIYPGVESEEERVRTQNQRAMYRRLFMDIEREQVKENQRKKQHRKKINDIKKSKEAERRLIEEQNQLCVEPKDPVTGETEAQSRQRKLLEQHSQERLKDLQVKQQQRSRDSERFLEALKRNLREKIEKQKVDLPPLCCCGPTVWDTNPDTCANNCVFYRNPKAYAQALQCLLASCDVL